MRTKAFQPSPVLTAGPALFLFDAALAAIAWSAVIAAALPGITGENVWGLIHLSLYPAAYLLLLYAFGLYRREALLETRKSLLRAPLGAVFGALLAGTATAILPLPLSTDATSVLIATAMPCFVAAGFVARTALFVLRRRGMFRRRLLIVGAGKRAWDLVWLLQREGRTLAYDIGFVHDAAMARSTPAWKVRTLAASSRRNAAFWLSPAMSARTPGLALSHAPLSAFFCRASAAIPRGGLNSPGQIRAQPDSADEGIG